MKHITANFHVSSVQWLWPTWSVNIREHFDSCWSYSVWVPKKEDSCAIDFNQGFTVCSPILFCSDRWRNVESASNLNECCYAAIDICPTFFILCLLVTDFHICNESFLVSEGHFFCGNLQKYGIHSYNMIKYFLWPFQNNLSKVLQTSRSGSWVQQGIIAGVFCQMGV